MLMEGFAKTEMTWTPAQVYNYLFFLKKVTLAYGHPSRQVQYVSLGLASANGVGKRTAKLTEELKILWRKEPKTRAQKNFTAMKNYVTENAPLLTLAANDVIASANLVMEGLSSTTLRSKRYTKARACLVKFLKEEIRLARRDEKVARTALKLFRSEEPFTKPTLWIKAEAIVQKPSLKEALARTQAAQNQISCLIIPDLDGTLKILRNVPEWASVGAALEEASARAALEEASARAALEEASARDVLEGMELAKEDMGRVRQLKREFRNQIQLLETAAVENLAQYKRKAEEIGEAVLNRYRRTPQPKIKARVTKCARLV
jgi:hypothetical protein